VLAIVPANVRAIVFANANASATVKSVISLKDDYPVNLKRLLHKASPLKQLTNTLNL
jgi:hypothetical protein